MHRTRLLVAAVATLTSFLTPLIWEGTAVASPPAWHLTKVFGPSSVGEMTGVDCVSATHCISTNYAGYIYSTTNGWSTTHRVRGMGSHAADTMAGVSCFTATSCVAVGGWGTSTTGYGVVTRSTNGGTTWVPEHTATTTWPLWAVSCPTSTVCFAAGDRNGHEAYWMKSTNGGSIWSAHVGIDPSIGVLDGISCDGASFCAVVGSIATSANTANGGTSWSDGTVPSNVRYLFGISCQLSSDCEAVGAATNGHGIALRSTDGGLHWTQMSIPASVRTLYGVTCVSSIDCFAVGRTGTTDTNGHGVALKSTNGTSWAAMTLPTGSSALLSIACVSASRCTAVGGNAQSEATVFSYL
jgi:hypothetical protein